jgi:two-component system OmpR family response regulator
MPLAANSAIGMRHILVVEDEQHLAIGIKFNLEAEGFRVSVAGDGPTALRLIEQGNEPVHLVILDIMLPGMSGYTVCETLREAGHVLPVLILSARTLAEDRTRGFDVGADQYLQKPFDLDELISRVRNLIARHAHTPWIGLNQKLGDAFEFDLARVKVNFSSFKVTVDGEPCRLTHMEMKLLRYFAENEGSVVSRSQLLDHVWGLSSSPTTRTVDNFVMRLRKYFEIDPAEPKHFLSVRGAGYQFVAEPPTQE